MPEPSGGLVGVGAIRLTVAAKPPASIHTQALGDAVSTALDVLATSLGAVSAQSLADLAALRPAALSVCAPGPFSLLAASEDVARAAASLQKVTNPGEPLRHWHKNLAHSCGSVGEVHQTCRVPQRPY